MFPYQTFLESRTLLLRHIKSIMPSKLREWQSHGFKISACTVQDRIASLQPHRAVASKKRIVGLRRVGDERSWIISLNTDRLTPSPFPDYLIDFASFVVESNASDSDMFGAYSLKVKLLKSPSLRFQYMLPEIKHERRYFEDRTILGMHLLPPTQQPQGMRDWFHRTGILLAHGSRFIQTWTPPENAGWVYYDDEMLEMLKAKYPELMNKSAEPGSRGTKRKRENSTYA